MRRGHLLVLVVLAALAAVVGLATQGGDEPRGRGEAGDSPRQEASPPPVLVGTGEAWDPARPPLPPSATPPAPPAPEGEPHAEPDEDSVPEPSGPATLVVRVVDGQGRPRSGLRVRLYVPIDGKWTFTHDVRLGDTGEVRFDDARAGTTYLWIDTPHAHRSQRLVLEAERPQDVEVVVPVGGVVMGTLRHVAKGALPDVDVTVEQQKGEFRFSVRTRTDAEGRFRLEGVPPGTHGVRLTGQVVGYTQRPRAQVTVRDGETTVQDLVLGRVAIQGRVRDAALGVELAEVRGDLVGTYAPFATDRSGTYRVLDVPPGRYKLWFARDGYQDHGTDEVVVHEGQVTTCDVELEPAGTLVLRFRDGAGRPVPGSFQLEFRAKGGQGRSASASRQADEHGVARYGRLGPGTYEVRATRDGYEIEAADVEVTLGQASVDLVCRRVEQEGNAVLRGVVTDARTREPVAGVRIRMDGGGGEAVSTDERGAYALRRYTGSPLRLIVSKDGYGIRFLRGVEVKQGEETVLDIALTPAAVLHLWLTDARGAPVVGDVVLVITPKDRDGTGTSVGTGVRADADGHAVYRQIVPADYELTVFDEAAGQGRADAVVRLGENNLRIRLE